MDAPQFNFAAIPVAAMLSARMSISWWGWASAELAEGADEVVEFGSSKIEVLRDVIQRLRARKHKLSWDAKEIADELARIDRYARLGIRDTPTLQAALREYLGCCREHLKAGKEDPIAKRKRELQFAKLRTGQARQRLASPHRVVLGDQQLVDDTGQRRAHHLLLARRQHDARRIGRALRAAARLEALQLHAQGLHLRGGYREFVRGLGGLQHGLARNHCESAAPQRAPERTVKHSRTPQKARTAHRQCGRTKTGGEVQVWSGGARPAGGKLRCVE